jgi:hypothetical protein
MAQSLGFATQFALGSAISPTLQATILVPLFGAALAGLWACDTFVNAIDGGKGARGARTSGSEVDDDSGVRTPLTEGEA